MVITVPSLSSSAQVSRCRRRHPIILTIIRSITISITTTIIVVGGGDCGSGRAGGGGGGVGRPDGGSGGSSLLTFLAVFLSLLRLVEMRPSVRLFRMSSFHVRPL